MIKMEYNIEMVLLVLGIVVGAYFLIKFLKSLQKRRYIQKQKRVFLSKRIRRKADIKFNKLLSKFKNKRRRNPTKDELFSIVNTSSHHVHPVKGRNSRRWTRGKSGHWKRQRVRKYLLEKHQVVKNFKMR